MNKDSWDLLLSFVIREKRFLRAWETSFTSSELKDADKTLKAVLKAFKDAAKHELEKIKKTAAARERMAAKLARKFRVLSKKQIADVIANYDVFYEVFAKSKEKENEPADRTKEDRYYSPKKHEYR